MRTTLLIAVLLIATSMFAVSFDPAFMPILENVDIVFAIDSTGSMGHAIGDVRSNISSFVTALDDVGSDFRFGAVTFGDGVNIWDFDPATPGDHLTDNIDEFLILLDGVSAYGGADIPEWSLEAMFAAINDYIWESERSRIVIMFTDAPYHYRDDGTAWSSELMPEELYDFVIRTGVPVFISHSLPAMFEEYGDFYDSLAYNSGGSPYSLRTSWDIIFDDIIALLSDYYFFFCRLTDLDPGEGLVSVTLEGIDGYYGAARMIDLSGLTGLTELCVGWWLRPEGGLFKIAEASYNITLITEEDTYQHSGFVSFNIEDFGKDQAPLPELIEISTFPNPFNSAVKIDAPNGAMIEIYNTKGQLIESGINLSIWQPREDTPSGVFIIKATKDNLEAFHPVSYIK